MPSEQRARSLISRGLKKVERREAIRDGDADKVVAIDKELAAPPTAAIDTARDQQRRRLVGKGYAHLTGPEITALRDSMAAAASIETPKPTSAGQMIANGLKGRTIPSRHDESYISNWAEQGGIRQT